MTVLTIADGVHPTPQQVEKLLATEAHYREVAPHVELVSVVIRSPDAGRLEGTVDFWHSYRERGNSLVGLEVTTYDAEGEVITSQDFG